MKFDNATKTASGYETRNVHFNGVGGCYIGQVFDPKAYGEARWQSATWDKRGKCRNQTRTDCDLLLPAN